MPDFPEITDLIGLKRTGRGKKITEDTLPEIEIKQRKEVMTDLDSGRQESQSKETKQDFPLDKKPLPGEKRKTKKSSKISIGFENNENTAILGRMFENTIWVNKNHPAFLKASQEGLEEYHILLCVGWVLAGFIEKEKSPLSFVSSFFSAWAKESQGVLLNIAKPSKFL